MKTSVSHLQKPSRYCWFSISHYGDQYRRRSVPPTESLVWKELSANETLYQLIGSDCFLNDWKLNQ